MMTRNSHNIDDPENKQTKGTQSNSNNSPTPAVLSPGLSEEKKKETVLQKNTLHLLGNRKHDRNNEVRVKRKNQKIFIQELTRQKKKSNKQNKQKCSSSG